MPRSLPYPGHTWSFTHHATGFEPETLYNLLTCAALFEGETKSSKKITDLMIKLEILTPNERDGKADAFRDYQQILPELGLIYSTSICQALTITELGHLLLAKEISFSEFFSIQALRYQYPNGQKSNMSSTLQGKLLENSGIPPSNLIELQMNNQILLKPGLLILQVLIGLFEQNYEPYLSISECKAFLIPCRNNTEWVQACAEIISNRESPSSINSLDPRTTRNIHDWFKFLKRTDFFNSVKPNVISLSSYVKENIQIIKNYCVSQGLPGSYWIPQAFDVPARMSWFDWFGHIPFDSQVLLRSPLATDTEYIEENFVAGIEEEIAKNETISPDFTRINLQPIDLDYLNRESVFKFSEDFETLIESLRLGSQKRHAKALLHDRIIRDLAKKFIAQDAIVESDPDSIDLFARWPSGDSAIFEVKTVTRRSLQLRLRTAIGQVEEYAYRKRLDGDTALADRVVVINTELGQDAWQTSFLANHLGIGLICKPPTSYTAFAPNDAKTKHFWKDF